MKKMKLVCFCVVIALSGAANAQKITAPQDVADHEASEYINRTSLSRKSIEESLLAYEGVKLSKKVVETAIAKAELEWGGPEIWNEKAVMSAETALASKKLSCKEMVSELIAWNKFTVKQANYAAKTVKVCS